MAKCTNCGAEVTDKMKFCSECGTRVLTDKECPACHARCSLAAKFCSECGHDFSKPAEEDADDFDNDREATSSSVGHEPDVNNGSDAGTDEEMSEEGELSSGGGSRASRTCIVNLKDAGSDRNAVTRELCKLLDKTFGEAKRIVGKAPTTLHFDCFREKAEEIAAALEAAGATVELIDKEIGTETSGSCSVVLKKLPFLMGRCDRAFVSAVIAEAMGCMPVNAWKMMDDLPLTIAENISREEAEEIASKIEARKCKVDIV